MSTKSHTNHSFFWHLECIGATREGRYHDAGAETRKEKLSLRCPDGTEDEPEYWKGEKLGWMDGKQTTKYLLLGAGKARKEVKEPSLGPSLLVQVS